MADYKYDAFISYRHAEQDSKTAVAIQHQLQRYHIPGKVQKSTGHKNCARIFRDKEELPVTDNLDDTIRLALKDSAFLIVLCSPRTKDSRWVEKELEIFLETHSRKNILTVIVEGEPEEVIPELLQNRDDAGGHAEMLSADYRISQRKARKYELPRLVAALIGCEYHELVDYRRRYYLSLTAAALAVAVVVAVLFALNYAQVRKNYRELQLATSHTRTLESESALEDGDNITAIQKALEALPEESGNLPYDAEAEYALQQATGAYGLNTEDYRISRIYEMESPIQVWDKAEVDGTEYLVAMDKKGHLKGWNLSGDEGNLVLDADAAEEDLLNTTLKICEDGSLLVVSESSVESFSLVSGKSMWMVASGNALDWTTVFDTSVALINGDSSQAVFTAWTNFPETGFAGHVAVLIDMQNGDILKQIPLSDRENGSDSNFRFDHFAASPDRKILYYSCTEEQYSHDIPGGMSFENVGVLLGYVDLETGERGEVVLKSTGVLGMMAMEDELVCFQRSDDAESDPDQVVFYNADLHELGRTDLKNGVWLSDGINDASFIREDDLLFVYGLDGVCVFDLETRECIYSRTMPANVVAADCSEDTAGEDSAGSAAFIFASFLLSDGEILNLSFESGEVESEWFEKLLENSYLSSGEFQEDGSILLLKSDGANSDGVSVTPSEIIQYSFQQRDGSMKELDFQGSDFPEALRGRELVGHALSDDQYICVYGGYLNEDAQSGYTVASFGSEGDLQWTTDLDVSELAYYDTGILTPGSVDKMVLAFEDDTTSSSGKSLFVLAPEDGKAVKIKVPEIGNGSIDLAYAVSGQYVYVYNVWIYDGFEAGRVLRHSLTDFDGAWEQVFKITESSVEKTKGSYTGGNDLSDEENISDEDNLSDEEDLWDGENLSDADNLSDDIDSLWSEEYSVDMSVDFCVSEDDSYMQVFITDGEKKHLYIYGTEQNTLREIPVSTNKTMTPGSEDAWPAADDLQVGFGHDSSINGIRSLWNAVRETFFLYYDGVLYDVDPVRLSAKSYGIGDGMPDSIAYFNGYILCDALNSDNSFGLKIIQEGESGYSFVNLEVPEGYYEEAAIHTELIPVDKETIVVCYHSPQTYSSMDAIALINVSQGVVTASIPQGVAYFAESDSFLLLENSFDYTESEYHVYLQKCYTVPELVARGKEILSSVYSDTAKE